MKSKFYALTVALAIMHTVALAQFVRVYDPGPTANLILNCIAKAQDGNYFVAGLQDTSIYLAEVNGAGNVIREKLVGMGINPNTNYYRLYSMIVDADGNIVIAGLLRPASNLLQGFLMKVSPALSVIFHVSYSNADVNEGVAFTDIKDFKTNTSNNAYYVTGYTFGSTNGWNALLMKLDRNTGATLGLFNGRPSSAATNNAQCVYTSLLLDTAAIAGSPGSIYVTAPLNEGSIASNRPWITRHNIGTLAFVKGERYLRDVTAAQQASLYNSSLVKDSTSLLYCWYGSPNVASNNTHTAMGLTKVDATSLLPAWQKRYTLTPASPSPFQYNALVKVLTDANGYVARGVWGDGAHEGGGEVFIIRTDKNGIPVWARQYKGVSNVQAFNSSFIIDGATIYAIGYKVVGGFNKGVLIKTPLATGSMDTTCASILTVQTADSTYKQADSLKKLGPVVVLKNNYYPINCITSASTKPCDTCLSKTVTLNTDFTLSGVLIGTSPTFTLTASAYSITNNSQFVVSQVSPSFPYPDITTPNTVLSISAWGTTTPTNSFINYQGSNIPATTGNAGIFNSGSLYRVRHIMSAYNNCGVLFNDTTSKIILLVPGLMAPKTRQFLVIDESKGDINLSSYMPAKDESFIAVTKSTGAATIFPNPANAFVTFNVAALKEENMVLKIVNGNGQTVGTTRFANINQSAVDIHTWANGLYLYNITSNGKVVAQGKFLVQH